MENQSIMPQGIKTFNRHEKAPETVLGSMIMSIDEFIQWIKSDDVKKHYSQYDGKNQLKFDIKTGKYGVFLTLNTYKPNGQQVNTTIIQSTSSDLPEATDDLPF